MEIAQEREWAEAQKIALSVDMVSAANRHLRFLAAVDQTGHLAAEGLVQVITRLINRGTTFVGFRCSLVVPLDCEWIWHCHRLNASDLAFSLFEVPILFQLSACKELFGGLLDNRHVVSSVVGEEIWGEMFPAEPYELDFLEDAPLKPEKIITDYDLELASAIERQEFLLLAGFKALYE